MRTLVVYFSRTGNTKSLAEQIALGCNAELEPIEESGDRKGISGYTRSLLQAAGKGEIPIIPTTHMPSDYELVILGTPVWGWNMSSPMRSYINLHRGQFRRLALFCTYGGSGQSRVLSDMQTMCGRVPLAKLAVKTRELQGDLHQARLEAFLREIRKGSTVLLHDAAARAVVAH